MEKQKKRSAERNSSACKDKEIVFGDPRIVEILRTSGQMVIAQDRFGCAWIWLLF